MFDGPPPAGVGALLALLENSLGQSGRVMARATVDGIDIADAPAGQDLDGVGRIEVESVTVGEAVARLALAAADDLERMRSQADDLATDVLRVEWSEAGGRCVQFGQELGRVLEGAAQVAAHAGQDTRVGGAAERLMGAVDSWIDAVKAADAAEVCLLLHRGVLPALEGAAAATRELGAPAP